MLHVYDVTKSTGALAPACSFSDYNIDSVACNEESVMKSEVCEYLSKRCEDLCPKLVVMYSQAHQGFIEAMLDPSFTVEYCSKTRWPVLLLPHSKKSRDFVSEGEEYLSRWTNHLRDSEG